MIIPCDVWRYVDLRTVGVTEMVRSVESLWKHDLPDRLDPVSTKELRQSLRRGSFVYPFLGIQVVCILSMIYDFQSGHVGDADQSGMMNFMLLFDSGAFWSVVAVFCMLIMPLGGLIMMGQELDEGNHELLQLTKVNRWRVVSGKFCALWGLCVLTFISLMPYMVVRYLLGGVEWWREAACAGTVLTVGAMICSASIAASSFKSIIARICILAAYVGSATLSCLVALGLIVASGKETGVIYHITAIVGAVSYTLAGLAIARSRMRLAVLAYEMNPSSAMIGMLVVTPLIIGLVSIFTLGWGNVLGFIWLIAGSLGLDLTPKLKKGRVPPSNVPLAFPGSSPVTPPAFPKVSISAPSRQQTAQDSLASEETEK